jgi:hypothetical protein
VRRLQLPTSSKIVPRPSAIIRTHLAARMTVTTADLGPAMISAVKHAASIRNPEFDARQRARRSTWDTPRFLYSYDETLEGDLVLPRGLQSLLTVLVESAGSALKVDDARAAGENQQFSAPGEAGGWTILAAPISRDGCGEESVPGGASAIVVKLCALSCSTWRGEVVYSGASLTL